MNFVILMALVSGFFLLCALLLPTAIPRGKWILFGGIVIPVVIGTSYLFYQTVEANLYSASHGPVHWHADFLISNCGQPLELRDPYGLLNRVGTPLLHEHNDKRIHVEGLVPSFEDISLGHFFEVVGGKLTNSEMEVLAVTGDVALANGDRCPDGSSAELQAFVISLDGKRITQRKLTDVPAYQIAHETHVPPGDCVVIEFGPRRTETDQLCTSYRAGLENGTLTR